MMICAVVLLCATVAVAGAIEVPVVKEGTVPERTTPPARTGPEPSEKFPFHEQLTDDYTLYWKHNASHITFEVVVRTTGWVGFGISPNGAMTSSDVIIGGVDGGQAYFAGHFLPAEDSSQDWTLLIAREVGEYTVLKVVRLLDTGDGQQDVPILEGTTRVIFAYSAFDGPSPGNYHGDTKGTKSIFLIDPPASVEDESSLPSDVRTFEFTNRNFRVPSADTTYWCTLWKLPDLGGKHHVIRYEPIIQAGHEYLLHHVVLWHCPRGLDEHRLDRDAFICYNGGRPWRTYECKQVFIAWAIGGKAFNYPSNVGFPVGDGDSGYFMMETHYDNPRRRRDFVDDSGLRVYLTAQLREHDAGAIVAGVNVDRHLAIPPYEEKFLYKGICFEECLAQNLGDGHINIFANFLHAHLLGSKLRLRHFRNGQELPLIQEDNSYDFNYQETRVLREVRRVQKGDSLVMECEYESTKRDRVTYGGFSTRQEMCVSFVLFYPRIPLSLCTSSVSADTWGYNWYRKSDRQRFQQVLSDSPHTMRCDRRY